MKTLFTAAFLFWVGITYAQNQKEETQLLKAEYDAYIAQMVKVSGDFGNFKNNPEFAKECHLYQPKWRYDCMPGGMIWIQKSESNTTLCEELPKPPSIREYGYSLNFSPDGKYAIVSRSIPMGTCDDTVRYYERIK